MWKVGGYWGETSFDSTLSLRRDVYSKYTFCLCVHLVGYYKGKRIVVTGASKGIGRGLALRLSQLGARCVGHNIVYIHEFIN